MNGDPFLIEGPALISFSGGRTSAYMLWRILQAHGGALPPDVVPVFANTGRERAETLRFVQDCAEHWDVDVVWVERAELPERYRKVSFDTASRDGEPFAALIDAKKYLPNAVTRFCTSELKIRVLKAYALALGWSHWSNVVGLRYDEGHRVLKVLAANDAAKERWRTIMPLSTGRITRRDVMEFWRGRNFDLQLRPEEGNCDLCFLKGREKLKWLIRERPESAAWWSAQEAKITMNSEKATVAGRRFVTEYSYAQLLREVDEQPLLTPADDDEHDAEYGLWCGARAA